MKKLFLILAIALAVISCRDSVSDELDTKQIISLKVNSSDWVENTDNAGLNRFYSYHFPINEINSNIYNNGAVVGYIELDGRQQALPYVRHFENSNGTMWTRTVDFDYLKGGVNIYVTNSDFVSDPPETMNFRIVLIW
ncbi:MAG: hypothetical protein KA172_01795 [Paludibacter sp.]|jgi:hypothetical protein|nr:hypothetical protein [Paludibacter sp.]MBP7612267.1 hypothetical protein [Paludibacter sp.]